MTTRLSEQTLMRIREAAHVKVGRFVDPAVIYRCTQVLDRRGEAWAASVLGRSLQRRSLLFPNRPWLSDAEPYALVEADRQEDIAALEAM